MSIKSGVTILIIFIVVWFGGGIALFGTDPFGVSTSHSQIAKMTTTPTTYPTLAPTYTPPVITEATFQPIVLTGVGGLTTPPFTITTNEWIVDWSFVPDPEWLEWSAFTFIIWPRDDMGLPAASAWASSDQISGSTYSYAGPDVYYAEVGASSIKSWQITIRPAP